MRYRAFQSRANISLIEQENADQRRQILLLLEHSFGEAFPKRLFDWKHMQRPSGKGENLLMIENGKVVGHWGLSPVMYKIGPDVVRAHVASDIAIDRQTYGRIEASKRLMHIGRMVYRLIEARGGIFGFGFPNTNSLFLGIKRLSWSPLLCMMNLAYFLRIGPFINKKLHSRILTSVIGLFYAIAIRVGIYARYVDLWPSWGRKVRLVDSFDERADTFWKEVSRKLKNCVVRDSAYLNWRFCSRDNPQYKVFVAERKGEMIGYIAVRFKRTDEGVREALIADLLVKDHNPFAASHLILTVMRYALRERCHVVRTWCLRHSSYYLYFRAVGFLKRKSLIHFCLRPFTRNPVVAARVMKPQDWHIMMSDSDSV